MGKSEPGNSCIPAESKSSDGRFASIAAASILESRRSTASPKRTSRPPLLLTDGTDPRDLLTHLPARHRAYSPQARERARQRLKAVSSARRWLMACEIVGGPIGVGRLAVALGEGLLPDFRSVLLEWERLELVTIIKQRRWVMSEVAPTRLLQSFFQAAISNTENLPGRPLKAEAVEMLPTS